MTPRPSTGSVRKLSLPLLGAALGNAVQARRLAVWIHGHPLPVFALSLHPSGQAGNGKERLAGRKDGHLHACVHETRHKRGSVLNTTGRSREGQAQPALDDGRCGGLGVPGRPRLPTPGTLVGPALSPTRTIMQRRSFLSGILAAGIAPAVLSQGSAMRIWVPQAPEDATILRRWLPDGLNGSFLSFDEKISLTRERLRHLLEPEDNSPYSAIKSTPVRISGAKPFPYANAPVPGVGPILSLSLYRGSVCATRSNGVKPVVWQANAQGWYQARA